MIHYERGEYVVRVVEQGWTKTKKQGWPMLVFDIEPLYEVQRDAEGNEQFAGVVPDHRFPTRRVYMAINSESDTSMDYAMKKLRHAGFTGDTFMSLNLVDTECRAMCDHGKNNDGEDRESWDFALPPLERSNAPIDTAVARRLDAIFGKKLKEGAAPATVPATAPVEQPVEAPSNNTDDVPF